MNRLYPLLLSLLLSFFILPTSFAESTLAATVAVDEEYDRYKKRGDDFFKEGKYVEARRQYQNCLEVPGFENDVYAKGQIEKCNTGLTLRQQADEALRQGKGQEATGLLSQLLTLNADDAFTKERLGDYYEREGNKLYNEQRYADAKNRYEQALKYTTTRRETLLLQIKNCEENMMRPKVVRRTGLKLLTGTVAVGAGVYALLLRSDFQTKTNALNQAVRTTDPDGDGIINTEAQYQQYDAAYKAVEAAQKKSSLYKACLGVAAVATLAEVYLLIRKPKAKLRSQAIRWQPSSQSWGLALRYDF